MFLVLNSQLILELVHFETLDQFSLSFFKIREFSLFNQILLSSFDISSQARFIKVFDLTLKQKCVKQKSDTILKCVRNIK